MGYPKKHLSLFKLRKKLIHVSQIEDETFGVQPSLSLVPFLSPLGVPSLSQSPPGVCALPPSFPLNIWPAGVKFPLLIIGLLMNFGVCVTSRIRFGVASLLLLFTLSTMR